MDRPQWIPAALAVYVCFFPSIKTQVHPRPPARRRRVKSLINPSVKMFKSKFVPSPLLWLPARLAARARWGLFGLAPPRVLGGSWNCV